MTVKSEEVSNSEKDTTSEEKTQSTQAHLDAQQLERAAIRHTQLLINALDKAKTNGGVWINPSGMLAPRIYPKGPSISGYNSLMLQLNADEKGYPSSQYLFFHAAKIGNIPVVGREKGVPFHWYAWERYVNRYDPKDEISALEYKRLPADVQKDYKGVKQRQIRVLFNVAQTAMPLSDAQRYRDILDIYGTANERGNLKSEERQLHTSVNAFIRTIKENLMPVRREVSNVAHFDTEKDAIYIPTQYRFEHYHDYVQELLRQVVTATGHQQRLAREGMVMKSGLSTGEDADRYERLVVELASAVKMGDFGLPGKISPSNIGLIDRWKSDLQNSPKILDALEADVNTAIEVIRKAQVGEKIEYARYRTQSQIADLKERQRSMQDATLEHTSDSAIDSPILFEKVQMLKDDNGRWAFYIKPMGESGFSIYPDKEDTNRFFSTLRQGQREESERLREQLANKYYQTVKVNPALAFDIFNNIPESVDTSRIMQVCIFKTKENRMMCSTKIQGQEDVAPREITSDQWSRMFLAEDMHRYKTALAAKVFSDILGIQMEVSQKQSENDVESCIERGDRPVIVFSEKDADVVEAEVEEVGRTSYYRR